jgi:hypothetical protein
LQELINQAYKNSVQILHQTKSYKNNVTKYLNHGLQGAKVQDSLATRNS